jgi:hypothetical protein
MLIWDSDDFGCNKVISDQCQSHDCRDQLDKFHYANGNFKATLFAIPEQMTYELCEWCKANNSWVELAVHGLGHTSNYECEKMTYDEFNQRINRLQPMLDTYFVKGFKAPGWQISDEIYDWLFNNGWWVADQGYNDNRRPEDLPVYKVGDNSSHHHCWDCVGNGVYEQQQEILDRIKDETEFKFVSEVV